MLKKLHLLLCITGILSSAHIEHVIGISQQDNDFRYNSVVQTVKSHTANQVWSTDLVHAMELVADATKSNFKETTILASLDTVARAIGEHIKSSALSSDLRHAVDLSYGYILSQSVDGLLGHICTHVETAVTRLEQEKIYWLWCKAHPWCHTATRTPKEWLFSAKQHELVAEKLRDIELLLSATYEQYGRLTARKLARVQCADAADHYQWAEQTIECVSAVVLYDMDHLMCDKSFSQAVAHMHTLTDLTDRYIKTLQYRVKALSRPSHVSRNWMGYTMATLGAAAAAYGYYHNQDAVHAFVSDELCGTYPEMIKDSFNQHVYKPLLDLWDSITMKTSISDSNQASKNLDRMLEKLHNEKQGDEIHVVVEENQLNTPPFSVKTKPTTVCYLSVPEQEAIVPAMTIPTPEVTVKISDELKELILTVLTYSKSEADATLKQRDAVAKLVIPTIATLPALFTAKTMGSWIVSSCKTLKRWFSKQDFRMIRLYISTIHDVLIASADSMTDEQYGRFMYSVQSLADCVLKHVPYYHTTSFINHLQQLACDDLNIEQKKDTITNMRATYGFLSPQYKI